MKFLYCLTFLMATFSTASDVAETIIDAQQDAADTAQGNAADALDDRSKWVPRLVSNPGESDYPIVYGPPGVPMVQEGESDFVHPLIPGQLFIQPNEGDFPVQINLATGKATPLIVPENKMVSAYAANLPSGNLYPVAGAPLVGGVPGLSGYPSFMTDGTDYFKFSGLGYYPGVSTADIMQAGMQAQAMGIDSGNWNDLYDNMKDGDIRDIWQDSMKIPGLLPGLAAKNGAGSASTGTAATGTDAAATGTTAGTPAATTGGDAAAAGTASTGASASTGAAARLSPFMLGYDTEDLIAMQMLSQLTGGQGAGAAGGAGSAFSPGMMNFVEDSDTGKAMMAAGQLNGGQALNPMQTMQMMDVMDTSDLAKAGLLGGGAGLSGLTGISGGANGKGAMSPQMYNFFFADESGIDKVDGDFATAAAYAQLFNAGGAAGATASGTTTGTDSTAATAGTPAATGGDGGSDAAAGTGTAAAATPAATNTLSPAQLYQLVAADENGMDKIDGDRATAMAYGQVINSMGGGQQGLAGLASLGGGADLEDLMKYGVFNSLVGNTGVAAGAAATPAGTQSAAGINPMFMGGLENAFRYQMGLKYLQQRGVDTSQMSPMYVKKMIDDSVLGEDAMFTDLNGNVQVQFDKMGDGLIGLQSVHKSKSHSKSTPILENPFFWGTIGGWAVILMAVAIWMRPSKTNINEDVLMDGYTEQV